MVEEVPAGCSRDTLWLHLKPRAKASTQTRGVLLRKPLGLRIRASDVEAAVSPEPLGANFGPVS